MNRKTFWTLFGVLAAVIIALAGMNLALDSEKTWDDSFPMANARVSWEQTFRAGAWSE